MVMFRVFSLLIREQHISMTILNSHMMWGQGIGRTYVYVYFFPLTYDPMTPSITSADVKCTACSANRERIPLRKFCRKDAGNQMNDALSCFQPKHIIIHCCQLDWNLFYILRVMRCQTRIVWMSMNVCALRWREYEQCWRASVVNDFKFVYPF